MLYIDPNPMPCAVQPPAPSLLQPQPYFRSLCISSMLVSLSAFSMTIQSSAPFTDRHMQKGQGVRCRLSSVQVPSVPSHPCIHILSRGRNSLCRDQSRRTLGLNSKLCEVRAAAALSISAITLIQILTSTAQLKVWLSSPHTILVSPLDWSSSFGKTATFFSPGLSMHLYNSVPLLCTPFGYLLTSYFLSLYQEVLRYYYYYYYYFFFFFLIK